MSVIYMDQMLWPQGKKKAITFSYDDGTPQDFRLVQMFRDHKIKATYNLNPGLFGDSGEMELDGKKVNHSNLGKEAVKKLYEGEDVAAHGWHHIFLNGKDSARSIREILSGRQYLEEMFKKIITGYAYAFGDCNQEISSAVAASGLQYARTVVSTGNFKVPENFLMWDPTCHHDDPKLFELLDRFLNEEFSPIEPIARLMYIWGHSFEFDQHDNWSRMEEILNTVSGRDDVWYASNTEIYNYVMAYRRLVFSVDSKYVYNPTSETIWLGGLLSDSVTEVKPGETVPTGDFIIF